MNELLEARVGIGRTFFNVLPLPTASPPVVSTVGQRSRCYPVTSVIVRGARPLLKNYLPTALSLPSRTSFAGILAGTRVCILSLFRPSG